MIERWTAADRSLRIFACAFLVRLAINLLFIQSFIADSDAYRRLAKAWANTGTYGLADLSGTPIATAYRPPLYPWLLSWFQLSWLQIGNSDQLAIATLHALLGALTVWLTVDLGKRLGLSLTWSILAGILVLFDPILIRQSTLVMTETLATFLGLSVWWLAVVVRTRATQARANDASNTLVELARGSIVGATLGIACLCRPTCLLWAVLWGLSESIRNPRFGASMLLICGTVLTPWWVRNLRELGQGVWMTTHGGYTLLLANNPILYEHWEGSWSREWNEDNFHAWWQSEQRARLESTPQGGAGELAYDRLASDLGWSTIREHPMQFLKGCFIRECWLWAWWPSQRQASFPVRFGIGLWYAGIAVLALLGFLCNLLQRGPLRLGSEWIPAWCLLASLCLVHAVYWSNMRMRAPLVPMISLLAVCGIYWVLARSSRLGDRRLPRIGD